MDATVEWGPCPEEDAVEAAVAVPHVVVLSTNLGYEYPNTPDSAVLDDQAALDAWLSAFWPPLDNPPVVDFAVDMALAAVIEADHTSCGVELDAVHVVALDDGTTLLDVRTHDDSATCDLVCDSFAEYVVVVTLARTTPAAVCTRRLDTCD